VTGAAVTAEVAPPRLGDPPIVIALADRARAVLGWCPKFDDIDVIVAHALAWEQKLSRLGDLRQG
jgi:UDP-glucose 4-epimerase